MSKQNILKFTEYLSPLAGNQSQELFGLDERKDNILTIAPLGFVVGLLFSVFNIVLTDYQVLGYIELFSTLFLLLPAILLVNANQKYIPLAENMLIACGLLIFTALVAFGGVGGSGLYWAFTFPFLSFFLKGQRGGWHWSLCFLLLVAFVLIALQDHPLTYHYDSQQIPHFLSSLLFIIIIASCFNLLRSRFQEKLQKAVIKHTAQAEKYLHDLQYQAQHDLVTGLPNKIRLDELLENEVQRAKMQHNQIVCLYVRLHRLPEIANIIGSLGMDEVMRQLSKRLSAMLGNYGFIGRPAREEILLCYRIGSHRIDSRRVLDAIRRADFSFNINGFPIHIEFTCGVAYYPEHAQDASNLLHKAEQSMLYALHCKSAAQIYDLQQERYFVQYHYRFGRLRSAIEGNELTLHFQPLINLHTGQLQCLEALARWFDPIEGFIPPVDFIPIAESSGLINHLTRRTLRDAMTACQAWQDYMPGTGVSINLSSRTLLDPSLPATLMDSLLESGVAAELVTLELTESTLLEQPENVTRIMQEIIRMGMHLSIDDYGTGFSSLAYLKKLPACELKIDQSFVRELTLEDGNLAIVSSTINLAHNLGLRVVAEGIENEETMQQLWLLGCDLGQGYFFSKPLPLESLRGWSQRYRFTPPDIIDPCRLPPSS